MANKIEIICVWIVIQINIINLEPKYSYEAKLLFVIITIIKMIVDIDKTQ